MYTYNDEDNDENDLKLNLKLINKINALIEYSLAYTLYSLFSFQFVIFQNKHISCFE